MYLKPVTLTYFVLDR